MSREARQQEIARGHRLLGLEERLRWCHEAAAILSRVASGVAAATACNSAAVMTGIKREEREAAEAGIAAVADVVRSIPVLEP